MIVINGLAPSVGSMGALGHALLVDGVPVEAPGIDVIGLRVMLDERGVGDAKAQFGDRLCFEGGVSVQTTLPFGTVEDVRRETEELIAVLGCNGGYILGPSHYIQAGTPPENILAMFEAIEEFCE